jgi:hypothetical protein
MGTEEFKNKLTQGMRIAEVVGREEFFNKLINFLFLSNLFEEL